MTTFGDRLRAAVKTERNKFTLDLGDNESIDLYAKPITGRDVEQITRKHKDFAVNPTVAAAVDMIIMKAETAEGEKAFTLEDKQTLLGLPMEMLAEIRQGLFPPDQSDVSDEAVEDELKN